MTRTEWFAKFDAHKHKRMLETLASSFEAAAREQYRTAIMHAEKAISDMRTILLNRKDGQVTRKRTTKGRR